MASVPIPLYVPDMRIVIDHPKAFLARRRQMGGDLLDEIWEGTLHMSPPPHGDHQELAAYFAQVVGALSRRHGPWRVLTQAGVREPGTPAKGRRANYRIPDVVVLPRDYALVRGWVEDGALLAVEVRSPREITRLKLPFYAERGVREVLHVDRETGAVELHRLSRGAYVAVPCDRGGWVACETVSLRIRRRPARSAAAAKPRGRRLPGAIGRIEVKDARGGGPLPAP